jgi:3-hydroxyacyl-CoA dehydrogenase/enoyl-CoA hydratase/carnithine racemase
VPEPATQFRLERDEDLGVVTIENRVAGRPNVFGRAALESLAALLPELERAPFKVLVFTGDANSFAAGADLAEFPKIETREQAIAGSRAGQDLFRRIFALSYPTVAAINGACLGGGLELALHCDYRVAAADVRHIGSPEVLLGFVPAWGATQLAPRIIGAQAAVQLIVHNPLRQNRMLDASQAAELGLVDRVTTQENLLAEAVALAESGVRPRFESVTIERQELDQVIARARSQVDDVVHGAAPAPYRALDLIAGSAEWSLDDGYRAEQEALADLLATPQAHASLYAFDLVERRAKRQIGRPDAEPRTIAKVGIAGAGLMATQLATLILRRLRTPVVLRDLDEETVKRAIETIHDELASAASRGRIDRETAVGLAAQASGATDWASFADCDLVLEAVFEDLDVKRQVFAELEDVVGAECILATNTSALSVTEMAGELRDPERVVGVHFFNPVALMPLVELVRTPETNETTLATAFDLAANLRKRPVLVNDAPGFVVNRLLTRMMTVVLGAIENGNSTEEVDEALLELGLPMAPSVLLQMVGPRVANHVLQTLHEVYPSRFPLSPTLANYAAGKMETVITGDNRLSAGELRNAALEALADETRHLLEEAVVESAEDVDMALLLGAGFPFFLGGITKHLDQTGISERVVGRKLAGFSTAAVP